jgi:hypothetical protein
MFLVEKNIMATPHNPHRLLQLLQICTWKSKCSLSYSGFETLSSNIIGCIDKCTDDPKPPDIKQKYLNDLLLAINEAITNGEDVGRNAEFISSILYYINLKNWPNFQEKLGAIESFIDFNKIDFSSFSETNISVIAKNNILDEVRQVFSFPEKTIDIPITYEAIEQDPSINILDQLRITSTKNPLIIWCIDDQANDALKAPEIQSALKALLELKQIIPIRIGETLSLDILRTSFLDKKHDTSGQHGLLMALSAICKSLLDLDQNTSKKDIKTGSKTQIGTLNNSGNIFLGENNQVIKGENINFGNFTQNIHKNDKTNGNES